MPEVLTSQDMASSLGWDLSIKFDNEADDESTVVTIQGQDQTDLLMSLTGAFNALDMVVHSARIDSKPGGEFQDVFHISTKSNEKVHPLFLYTNKYLYQDSDVHLSLDIGRASPVECH